MMTMPNLPNALNDAMALLRLAQDPKAAQAIVASIAEAREKALADVEKREAVHKDACAAREKALEAREAAVADREAAVIAWRERIRAAAR